MNNKALSDSEDQAVPFILRVSKGDAANLFCCCDIQSPSKLIMFVRKKGTTNFKHTTDFCIVCSLPGS